MCMFTYTYVYISNTSFLLKRTVLGKDTYTHTHMHTHAHILNYIKHNVKWAVSAR